MKTCIKCGAQLDDSVKFCNKCGTPAADVAQPQPQPQPAQPQPAQPQPAQPQPAQPQPQQTQPQPYVGNQQQNYQQNAQQNSTDHTSEFDPKDISENKLIAICPYLFGIMGMIFAVVIKKDSKFVMFHVNQALKLNICLMFSTFLMAIPIVNFVAPIISVILFVVLIIALISAWKGYAKEVPIVSNLGFLK